jgi:hypothetical protein
MMAGANGRLMTVVLGVLKILIVLNLVSLVLFAGILAGSVLAEARVTAAILESGSALDPVGTLAAVRLVMAVGIVAVPLAHVLLTRLKAMVETVRAGDPFVRANAERLHVIAWCLFGLQLCDLGFGAVSMHFAADAGPVSGWTISLTGWLAVALLFVLARVFAHGTDLRDELEGTV